MNYSILMHLVLFWALGFAVGWLARELNTYRRPARHRRRELV